MRAKSRQKRFKKLSSCCFLMQASFINEVSVTMLHSFLKINQGDVLFYLLDGFILIINSYNLLYTQGLLSKPVSISSTFTPEELLSSIMVALCDVNVYNGESLSFLVPVPASKCRTLFIVHKNKILDGKEAFNLYVLHVHPSYHSIRATYLSFTQIDLQPQVVAFASHWTYLHHTC